MDFTVNEVEKILKTLPIGYYIKRNVEVKLDETSGFSYYDPMNDKICISFSQLSKALSSLKDSSHLENDIRTMLYHEVSHAFITPKNLKMNKQMNIIEDERIESVLRHFYRGVNFREFVRRVNDFHGQKPADADEAFYQLVRFRIGERKWLEKLHDLINKYSSIHKSSYPYDYQYEVDDFYNEFIKEYKEKEKEKKEEEKSKDSESYSNEFSNDNNGSNDENESDESDEPKNEQMTTESIDVKESDFDNEDIIDEYNSKLTEEIVKTINKFNDATLVDSINQILSRISSTTKRNGSSINSYSGQFDIRSTIRDDYKFFVQQNRLGHVKAHSKVKLNLFIDRSGSFHRSETKVNQLLFALTQFEKKNPNFEFDLVTCGMSNRLEEKSNRTLVANGGNRLEKNIFDIFKKLQDKQSMVYNIVLFDGDAFTDFYRMDEKIEAYKNFGAFNTSNTTIISDFDNESNIKRYCGSAKQIFTRNYAGELIDNVLKTLNIMCR